MLLLVILFLILLAIYNLLAGVIVTGILVALVVWASTSEPSYKARSRRRGR